MDIMHTCSLLSCPEFIPLMECLKAVYSASQLFGVDSAEYEAACDHLSMVQVGFNLPE